MGKPKKPPSPWRTDYERFFHEGQWDELMKRVVVPLDCLTYPPADGDTSHLSWDRKAAYLLWSALNDEEARERLAATHPQSSDESRRRLLVQSSWGPFSASGDW